MLRESQTPRGEPIEVRRGETLLPIATEVAVAQIIGQDEDKIGRPLRGMAERARQNGQEESNQ